MSKKELEERPELEEVELEEPEELDVDDAALLFDLDEETEEEKKQRKHVEDLVDRINEEYERRYGLWKKKKN